MQPNEETLTETTTSSEALDRQERLEAAFNRRDSVLNAAEALFSKHGFDGVTMRQVASMAKVDVALPNYYFTSKRGLFDAVFARRAAHLNASRAQGLDAALASHPNKDITVHEIITAFVAPISAKQANSDTGWRHYCRLVAQVNASPEQSSMMTAYYDSLIEKFIDALRLALPGVDDKKLYWAYHFLSGALTLTMAATGRIDHLSNGVCRSDDAPEAYAHLVDFFTDAFEGLRA